MVCSVAPAVHLAPTVSLSKLHIVTSSIWQGCSLRSSWNLPETFLVDATTFWVSNLIFFYWIIGWLFFKWTDRKDYQESQVLDAPFKIYRLHFLLLLHQSVVIGTYITRCKLVSSLPRVSTNGKYFITNSSR